MADNVKVEPRPTRDRPKEADHYLEKCRSSSATSTLWLGSSSDDARPSGIPIPEYRDLTSGETGPSTVPSGTTVDLPVPESQDLAARLVPLSDRVLHQVRFIRELSDDESLTCPVCRNVLNQLIAAPLPDYEHNMCRVCCAQ